MLLIGRWSACSGGGDLKNCLMVWRSIASSCRSHDWRHMDARSGANECTCLRVRTCPPSIASSWSIDLYIPNNIRPCVTVMGRWERENLGGFLGGMSCFRSSSMQPSTSTLIEHKDERRAGNRRS